MSCVRKRYGTAGFWSVARIERHLELALMPSVLYLVEFEDTDGTVFRKFGVAKHGVKFGRLYKHRLKAGTTIASAEGDRLSCLYAEALIHEYVAPYAYRPSQGRLDAGGVTECFIPKAELDLERWLDRGRLLAGRVRLVSRSGGAAAWERPSFTAAESKWVPAVPSYLRLLQAHHAAVTSQLGQDDELGLEITR